MIEVATAVAVLSSPPPPPLAALLPPPPPPPFDSVLSRVLDRQLGLVGDSLALQAELRAFHAQLANQSIIRSQQSSSSSSSSSTRKRRSRPRSRGTHARRRERTFGDWSGEWLQDGEGSLGVAGEPPKLLLLYHMEKCGGTSVKQWLSRNVRPPVAWLPRRLDAVIDYALAKCFLCAQWGEGSSTPLLHRPPLRACKRCITTKGALGATAQGAPLPQRHELPASLVADGAYERARVAVEFHANSKALFWSHVVPRLPALRALYAHPRLNGTVVTATVLRHPVAHLFSAFYMWPPAVERTDQPGRRRRKARKALRTLAMPFPKWIETAEGAQAGLLSAQVSYLYRGGPGAGGVLHAERADGWAENGAGVWLPTAFSPPSRGMHNPAGCAAVQNKSLHNLAVHFDVVGVTDCLATFLDDLETSLALQPADSTEQRARRRKGPNGHPNVTLHVRPTSGTSGDGALAEQVHAWAWPTLNATVRARLIAVAACDMRLYEAARRRIAAAAGASSTAPDVVDAASDPSGGRASCPEHSMDDLVFVRGNKSHPRRPRRRRRASGAKRNGTSRAAGSGNSRGRGRGRGRTRSKHRGLGPSRRRRSRAMID